MSLVRWNNNRFYPNFSNFVDKFFDNNWEHTKQRKASTPSVNILKDEASFTLEVAAPGLKKEDFKLDLHENILTVSAKKESQNTAEDKNEKGNYTRKEFSYTSFERSFTLPDSVEQEDIQANYEDGILNILLPKKEDIQENKSRQITIS